MKNLVVSMLASAVTASFCVYYLTSITAVDNSPAVVQQTSAVQTTLAEEIKTLEPLSGSEALLEKVAAIEAMQKSLQAKVAALNAQALSAESSVSQPIIETVDLREVEEEEQLLVEQNSEQSFEALKENFYFEGQDYAWAADMSDSFADIESLLLQLNIDSVDITHQECRSATCIIEYTYTDEEQMQKVRPLLVARHASSVMFKEIQEDGVNKTIALYRR